MKQPLVSVIVPTYNSTRFLVRCLDSIRLQTYKNIELIVVDNNSTDDTKDIAKRYTKHVFNKGPERSAQVNFGVTKASGEFIYKVDSDFELDPNVIEQCIDKAAEGFDAIVVHNTPDTSVGWVAKIRKFEVDMYKYDLTHSSARFVRKDVYQNIGGFNEKITAGEDYDFQNKLTRSGYKTGFVDAEALHLGEPKSFWKHMKKFYAYGKDFTNYKLNNQKESKSQLSFIRSVYVKHWQKFLRHPITGYGFIIYNFYKYGFGAMGYFSAKRQAHKRGKSDEESPVALIISQVFLPGGGGLERFIDFVATGIDGGHLAKVEIICLSRGSPEAENEFDLAYPLRVYRVRSKLYVKAEHLSQRFNTIVGGNQRLSALGKVSMLMFVFASAYGMFTLVLKRGWANRKSPMIFHCMSLSSLVVAVTLKKLWPFNNIKIILSNQFVYTQSGFKMADSAMRYLFRQTDKVVCVSRFSADQVIKAFGLDKDRTEVCYSWQPLPELDKNLYSEMSKRKKGKTKILFVGRIVPEKGINNIIRLAQYINENGMKTKYQITIIGDSNHPIKNDLLKATNKYENLNYLGRVDNHLLWKYYASHNVFLLPIEWEEAFGRVIIEAYSMGLPVVASNMGAVTEILSLFPKATVLDRGYTQDVLLESINNLCEFTKTVEQLSFLAECREIVGTMFSSKNFNTYRTVYNEILTANDARKT
jgi:glycosyltransferase involved in cell wall biosynthesis